jgi:hypothetical protein
MNVSYKLTRLHRLLRFLNHKIRIRHNKKLTAKQAEKRRINVLAKLDGLHTLRDPAQVPTGTRLFDGKEVAEWIYPWLELARKKGWTGTVTSGYRSPAYSQSLCLHMCGQPSCPGRCAGTSSNHSGLQYPGGAVDVTEYEQFGRIQRRIGSPLQNQLPTTDPVHFSVSGR